MMKHISVYTKQYTRGWACSLHPMTLYTSFVMMTHRFTCNGVHWRTDKMIKK